MQLRARVLRKRRSVLVVLIALFIALFQNLTSLQQSSKPSTNTQPTVDVLGTSSSEKATDKLRVLL